MVRKDSSGLRVLIVDDEVEFAETLAMRLELRKFQVTVAHNGREALQLMEQQQQDLMLLDLKIPEVNGLEVAERLRAADCSTKIIIVSGDGPAAEREIKIEPPVVAYMTKPVELRALLCNIEGLFEVA